MLVFCCLKPAVAMMCLALWRPVNHRGGKSGFISVNGVQGEARILLPDYAGNGAFEAAGNIWETRRAAVFVPDPARGNGGRRD
jgi:hypothetical protein